jgi:hypothetical protein
VHSIAGGYASSLRDKISDCTLVSFPELDRGMLQYMPFLNRMIEGDPSGSERRAMQCKPAPGDAELSLPISVLTTA